MLHEFSRIVHFPTVFQGCTITSSSTVHLNPIYGGTFRFLSQSQWQISTYMTHILTKRQKSGVQISCIARHLTCWIQCFGLIADSGASLKNRYWTADHCSVFLIIRDGLCHASTVQNEVRNLAQPYIGPLSMSMRYVYLKRNYLTNRKKRRMLHGNKCNTDTGT